MSHESQGYRKSWFIDFIDSGWDLEIFSFCRDFFSCNVVGPVISDPAALCA